MRDVADWHLLQQLDELSDRRIVGGRPECAGRPARSRGQASSRSTDKRILRLLDKPPPEGFARWTGPLLAEALGDVDVQYVWRFLRNHKIDLVAKDRRINRL